MKDELYLPKGKARLGIWINAEVLSEVKALAKKYELKLSDIVRLAVKEYLIKHFEETELFKNEAKD